MELLHILLITATLLSSLVAGLVFTFAVIAMPGLGDLEDREFLGAFQAIDRVIQNNQPVFMAVWVGSIATILLSAGLGAVKLDGLEQALVIAAALVYLGGVQAPTAAFNIPLNNQIQTLELQTLGASALAEARSNFEGPWNRWNIFRTVMAILTSAILLILLVRL